jgi:hypothetical protein
MSAATDLRRLTVAHQKEGECAYCDRRYARVLEAAYLVGNEDPIGCHCGCGACPPDCQCPGNKVFPAMCECEDG